MSWLTGHGHNTKRWKNRKKKKKVRPPRHGQVSCSFSCLLNPLRSLHQKDLQPVSSNIGTGDLSGKVSPLTPLKTPSDQERFSHRRVWESLWVHARSKFHNFLSVQIPGYLFLLRNFQGVRYVTRLLFCWSTEGPYRQTVTLGENVPKDWYTTVKELNNSWKEKG